MSAKTHNLEQRSSGQLLPTIQSTFSIDELRARASINELDREAYSVERWINSVQSLFDEGEKAFAENKCEDAYICYMRGCRIMLEIIPSHSKYNDIRKDPSYGLLQQRLNDKVFNALNETAVILEDRYETIRQQQQKQQQQQQMHFMQQQQQQQQHIYNLNYPQSPTMTAAFYAYKPMNDPRNFPQYYVNGVPPPSPSSQQQNVVLTPRSSASSSTNTTASSFNNTPFVQSNFSHSSTNSSNTTTTINALSQAVSSKLKMSDNSVIRLPTWTSNIFPETRFIGPLDLATWITKRDDPPSVLLIDVRPRSSFESGCIKHQWIIQIEPDKLRINVTTTEIQESLLRNPEAEQTLFSERARFDLIIYYDQNSQSLDMAHDSTVNIRKALESQKIRRPPMMLTGGFDAWQATLGNRGIYKFPVKEKKHWFKSNHSTSSSNGTSNHAERHEYHSSYDYNTSKPSRQQLQQPQQVTQQQHQYYPISIPQPLPTAPRKESVTTRYTASTPNKPTELPSLHYKQGQLQQQQQQQQDLRPMPPSYSKINRTQTFIDNPFNGFTRTNSKIYGVPPTISSNKPTEILQPPPPHLSQQPRSSSADPIIPNTRPFAMTEFHHASTSNLHQLNQSNISTPLHKSGSSGGGAVISIGTTGLKNLGNTCYMNSILQCMSGTIPLARYFLSGKYKYDINRTSKTSTGGVLVEAFAELIRVMWSNNFNFISPMTFRDALVRFAPRFAGSDQQDSQEFLMYLLDGLHEDVNKPIKDLAAAGQISEGQFEKIPDWQASALSWEKHLTKNHSVIVDLFQGQYRSRLTCLSCKETSTTYNEFMPLSLPIPVKKMRLTSVSLYQCLDYFVKEETLDSGEAWNCPKCRKKRKATKQLTLTKLPDILLIHLKRFSLDGLFRNKLDAMVKCPTRSLDLSGYIPTSMTPPQAQDRSSYIYDLYAVSNHYGSLAGGHYTACVRDGHDKWHYFNDSKISLCDENKVVTKAAYNLFYVRSQVQQ